MTLMIGLHHFFLEISKKCWPRFLVQNSTEKILLINFLKTRKISGHFYCFHDNRTQCKLSIGCFLQGCHLFKILIPDLV
jgi:hypothetical protein